jgi:hypothetical protein
MKIEVSEIYKIANLYVLVSYKYHLLTNSKDRAWKLCVFPPGIPLQCIWSSPLPHGVRHHSNIPRETHLYLLENSHSSRTHHHFASNIHFPPTRQQSTGNILPFLLEHTHALPGIHRHSASSIHFPPGTQQHFLWNTHFHPESNSTAPGNIAHLLEYTFPTLDIPRTPPGVYRFHVAAFRRFQ